MFLRRLVLRDVRSIEALDLSFDGPEGETRKWTFLLGENGTGKSTVLRAAALVLVGSEAMAELLENPDTWIRAGRPECWLHAELETARGQPRTVDLKIQRGDKIKDIFRRNQKTIDALDRAIEHAPRNYFLTGYGVSRRLGGRTSDPSTTSVLRHPRSQALATLFLPEATLNPLESWAMDLHYRRGEEGLEAVRNSLSELLPDVELERIDPEQRQLLFRTPDGILPLSALSDGYQNVASWCGDLLYRITTVFANYKDPLIARGLLLIDEIDLHLHPVWKRCLVDFLGKKLPNFQIVATTHSPVTVHQAGPGELFFLRREDPKSPPVLRAYPGTPRNLLLHQLLLSPMFGLSTLDSQPVEAMREEFRRLQTMPTEHRSAEQQQSFQALQSSLQDLPDWSTESPHDRKQRELLEEIQETLRSEASPALTKPDKKSSPAARGKSVASKEKPRPRPKTKLHPDKTKTTATRDPKKAKAKRPASP